MNNYLVDIVIPVFNKLDLTRDCLNSIKEHSSGIPHRLILIDNASSQDTKKFLEDYASANSNVTLIRNKDNLGWVKAINQGIRISESPYISIMNNDTIVRTHGWLARMTEIAEKEADIGLLNPRFEIKNIPVGDKPYIEVDFCRGYCVLIKRAVIERIGVFDEAYGLGYYDDDDYSVRAIRAGFRCVRVNDVFVEHLRDSTFTAVFKDEARRALHERNKELFYSKWGKRRNMVFIITKEIDRNKALAKLFSLARKQHVIYVWNRGKPLSPEHINIREKIFPRFFPKFFFSLMIYLNKLKKPSKHYAKVFWNEL